MYYIYGLMEVKKMIAWAIGGPDNGNLLLDQLAHERYCDFLKKVSVFETSLLPRSTKVINFSEFKKISPDYIDKNILHFDVDTELLQNRIATGYFQTGLNILKTKQCNLYELVQFIIKFVLVSQLKSYTNGTTEKTIGLSLLDFKDHFDHNDFVELLIHQLTHMLLFIDDYSDHHIASSDKNIMINTALKYKLGGNQFPIYLAFHSFVVGVEILAFRYDVMGFYYKGNYHGSTQRIIEACDEFQSSLSKQINYFSKRAQLIFVKAQFLFSNLKKLYYTDLGEAS